MRTDEEDGDWREKANDSPEYYLDSEAGRKELLEMIRAEADRLLQEVQKRYQPIKEIIWFSSHCVNCRYSNSPKRNENSTCIKWNCRLVRPFYGKPIWVKLVSTGGKDQLMISDINWDDRALNVTDLVIEEAMDRINGGFPYPCFEPSK
jgi:hypothetical protein